MGFLPLLEICCSRSHSEADSRDELRNLLLNRPSGGIVFTTIQKFGLIDDELEFPLSPIGETSSSYATKPTELSMALRASGSEDGTTPVRLARHLRDGLPNATFLAFTGTPVSEADKDTRAVFGNYISIYDIKQAVDDGATVPIYYESRLAKLDLDSTMAEKISDLADEALEEELDEETERERVKTKWSTLEAIAGSEPRLRQIAEDLVEHYESRSETQPGKAMVVCMSREICARLYDEVIKLRPAWHDDDHMKGAIKVIMTASAAMISFSSLTTRISHRKRARRDSKTHQIHCRSYWSGTCG